MEEILLTPGPTHIPPQVLAAMQEPKMHHRTEVFKQHFRKSLDGLKSLLKASSDPVLLAGSGTAAMEAALLNVAKPGDTAVVMNAGKFGERWLHIAARLDLKTVEIKIPYGQAGSAELAEKTLRSNGNAKILCLQHCESSTGALNPAAEICRAAKKINPELLTVVDAVSSVGTLPLHPDSEGIDVLAAAAHKGLMLPPGLSFVYLSTQAWETAEKIKPRTLYFDLSAERKAHAKDTTAWTPAVQHILGLNASLEMIFAEGTEKVFSRHGELAAACRKAVSALGLKLFAHPAAPGLTAIEMPDGVDGEAVRSHMLKQHKVRVAGGQEELKGRIIRIGHMGYFSREDLKAAVRALADGLSANGFKADADSASAVFGG